MSARNALEQAVTDAKRLAGGDVLRCLEALEHALSEAKATPVRLKFGDRVRTSCTATGRYLGKFGGKELALFVSAMDNSVCVDVVDRDGDPPHPGLPVPTDRELEAAANGIRWGLDHRETADA
jgi:hypothetical protein